MPDTKQNVPGVIADYIANKIIKKEFANNQRIPEKLIIDELNVSRSSIRKALQILENWHLIEVHQNRGAIVKDVTAEILNEFYEVYNMILIQILKNAHSHLNQDTTPLVLDKLQTIKTSAEKGCVDEFHDNVIELFQFTSSFIDNSLLENFFNNLLPAMSRNIYLALKPDPVMLGKYTSFLMSITIDSINNNISKALWSVEAMSEAIKHDTLTAIEAVEP